MEQEKKKKIIYAVIALVVLVGLGILFSYISGNIPKNEGNVIFSGIVEQKNENAMIVDVVTLRGVAGNPTDQKILKTIIVNSNTIIKKQIQKDPAVFDSEQKSFMESQKNPGKKVSPPVPFIESQSSYNGVSIGSFLTIHANKSIELNDEVIAKSILINDQSMVPEFSDMKNVGIPNKVVGVVGWIGGDAEKRFAVDKGDGTRVQIRFDSNTIFSRQENKSEKEYQEEMDAFKKGILVTIPVPVKDFSSSFSELDIGKQIEVQGIGDQINGVLAERVTLLVQPKNQ